MSDIGFDWLKSIPVAKYATIAAMSFIWVIFLREMPYVKGGVSSRYVIFVVFSAGITIFFLWPFIQIIKVDLGYHMTMKIVKWLLLATVFFIGLSHHRYSIASVVVVSAIWAVIFPSKNYFGVQGMLLISTGTAFLFKEIIFGDLINQIYQMNQKKEKQLDKQTQEA